MFGGLCYHGNKSTILLFYSIFRTTPETSSKLYFVEICQVSEKLWLFSHKRADFWLPNFGFKTSFLSLLKPAQLLQKLKKAKEMNNQSDLISPLNLTCFPYLISECCSALAQFKLFKVHDLYNIKQCFNTVSHFSKPYKYVLLFNKQIN